MSASTSEKPKEEPAVKKDEGKKNNEDKDWKGGEVVWAKVPGFNYWPGKVFNSTDDLVPQWLKGPPEDGDVLIRFFGTYDMEWVDPKHVEGYQKGLQKKFQSKNKRKVFVKAVKEAKLFVESSELPDGMKVQPTKIKSSDDESEIEKSPPPRAKRTATRKATPASKKGRKKPKLEVEKEDQEEEDGKSDKEEEDLKTTTEQ
ncbi:hypothetical protein EMCRGX_G021431 [Ephydatia muelleri]|eukprot:Em0009g112a